MAEDRPIHGLYMCKCGHSSLVHIDEIGGCDMYLELELDPMTDEWTYPACPCKAYEEDRQSEG